MAAALERADRLLAVCTEAYSTSAFGGAELRAAFARHPVAEGRIVPVLIEPVTLPPLYATLNSLDLTGLDEAAAAARLRGRLAGTRPTGPAPFPRRVKPAGLSTSLGHAAPSDRRRFRPEFATAVPRDAACFVPSGANVTGRTDAGLNDRDPRVGRRRRRGEVGDEGSGPSSSSPRTAGGVQPTERRLNGTVWISGHGSGSTSGMPGPRPAAPGVAAAPRSSKPEAGSSSLSLVEVSPAGRSAPPADRRSRPVAPRPHPAGPRPHRCRHRSRPRSRCRHCP
jgi:hypothetical protein